MIATRYVAPVCVLLGLALVPTMIHSYADDRERDGRLAAGIPVNLAGYTGFPTDRNDTWGERRFNSDDWMERTYERGAEQVRVAVIRSFDAKTLYHHPELAVAYGTPFAGLETRRFAARPDVPVFVLQPGPGVNAAAMYVLHSGNQFVEAPIRFQLQTAGRLLFSRRAPMTLFFVFDPDVREGSSVEDSDAARLLFAAIDGLLMQEP